MNKDSSSSRFGYEWQKYSQLLPQHKEQFDKWTCLLSRDYFKDKEVLDAGGGMGRNSYWCLQYGADKVVLFDNDDRTVESAKNVLKSFPNAYVNKQNIYNLQYKDKFDIVMCIGVIHHLKEPTHAINNLAKAVKPGGKLLIWVYGYEGNEWIVRFINPIRFFTSRLPPVITDIISYCFSVPLYLRIKLLKSKNPYYQQLKGFDFDHIHAIVFDQLLPKIARYYKKEEAQSLLSKLQDVQIARVNENSWCVMGTKQ